MLHPGWWGKTGMTTNVSEKRDPGIEAVSKCLESPTKRLLEIKRMDDQDLTKCWPRG